MKKKILISSVFSVMMLVGIISVGAVTRQKSLDGGYGGTTIRVTMTYDNVGSKRWSLGTAYQIASTGMGGSSSKSGGLTTSKLGSNIYQAKQKYSISSTDYNYNTVSGTRTFTWEINDSTLIWQNCSVK